MRYLIFVLLIPITLIAKKPTLREYSLNLNTGYSYNIIFQNGFKYSGNYGNQYYLGLSSEKKINKYNLFVGFNVSQLEISNFENSFLDIKNNKYINLNTSISQTSIELPVLIKKSNSIYNYGIGIIFSYLLKSSLNQKVSEINDLGSMYDSFHAVYDIHNYKETSPFVKTNFSPCVNFGVRLKKKLSLQFVCSYQILSNPVNNYKFNSFNSFNNSLFLTFNIN